jgi:hypothetical protein
MAAWKKRAAMDKAKFADKSGEQILESKPSELIAEGEAKQHQHHPHRHPHHDRPQYRHHHDEQQEQQEQHQAAVMKREDAHAETAALTKRVARGNDWDNKRQHTSSFGSKLRKMIARGLVVAENGKEESKDVFAV